MEVTHNNLLRLFNFTITFPTRPAVDLEQLDLHASVSPLPGTVTCFLREDPLPKFGFIQK